MRTTIDLDPSALEAVRQLASHRAQSIGKVVSELIFKGLRSDVSAPTRSGFPVFAARPDAPPITLEDVQQADEDE